MKKILGIATSRKDTTPETKSQKQKPLERDKTVTLVRGFSPRERLQEGGTAASRARIALNSHQSAHSIHEFNLKQKTCQVPYLKIALKYA
ncbi:MAG TPA: hypothetical protein DEB73_03100 [Candidatus Magasanikbacteria bacterium]|nr:hypothetical protein [Candidatus Magasanikbacteria bacterium]HBX15840.1 hypothetical protein [Candidatus Magasanikbacteria bacterium]